MSDQLTFLEPSRYGNRIKTPAHQRHSSTSEAAAEQIAPKVSGLRQQVYEYIKSQGERGATDLEIQQALGMKGSTERPRCRELEQAGLVCARDMHEDRLTRDRCTVWFAMEELSL